MNLLELAAENPNITISIKLSELIEANKVLVKEAKKEMEQQLKEQQSEEYMTVEQVCEKLQVDASTLWRWNRSGYLTKVRVGGSPRYHKSDVQKLLNKPKK